MEYVPQKTIAIFEAAGRKKIRALNIKVGDITIELRFSLRYLGIMQDGKLLWMDHAMQVRRRIFEAANTVGAVAGNTWETRSTGRYIVEQSNQRSFMGRRYTVDENKSKCI